MIQHCKEAIGKLVYGFLLLVPRTMRAAVLWVLCVAVAADRIKPYGHGPQRDPYSCEVEGTCPAG
jgi:hypothetical protein